MLLGLTLNPITSTHGSFFRVAFSLSVSGTFSTLAFDENYKVENWYNAMIKYRAEILMNPSAAKAIEDFVLYAQSQFPRANFLAILETTRGCPYGCTYCDWGGGVGAKVIAKDLEYVEQDIEAISKLKMYLEKESCGSIIKIDTKNTVLEEEMVTYIYQILNTFEQKYSRFIK